MISERVTSLVAGERITCTRHGDEYAISVEAGDTPVFLCWTCTVTSAFTEGLAAGISAGQTPNTTKG